jgi:site-specific DNA-cytosine methylase
MKAITELSLFNGCEGASMAMSELNIPVKKMYASEVDKFATKAAQLLFPNTIHLGDVTKWRTWGIDWNIDKLDAGSPCQGFSGAGKHGGTKAVITGESGRKIEIVISSLVEYEFTRKLKLSGVSVEYLSCSYLFWEFVAILEHIKSVNPDVKFMLENVMMTQNNKDMISRAVGVEPVMINAALVTAQNRKRNYWTNWEVSQPEDKGILLKDIIEGGTIDGESVIISQRARGYNKGGEKALDGKTPTLSSCSWQKNNKLQFRSCELRDTPPAESAICHHVATATDINANESNKRIYADTGKSPTLTTCTGGHREPKVLVFLKGLEKGRRLHDGKSFSRNFREGSRVYSTEGKAATLTAKSKGGEGGYSGLYAESSQAKYRKLTPRECMRLQGFPTWVIDKLLETEIVNGKEKPVISNSQLYKMTGNGWAIPVITHILQCLLDTGWMQD